jgi:hypothetical protein
MWFFLLAALLGQPFEDVERRFHLDLPAEWHFAPQPGDTHGAVFRRLSDGVYANAMVRVMPVPGELTLADFAKRIRAASENEPGYRSIERRACSVGQRPAECRRFLSLVNGDPKMPKMAEQRIVLAAGRGFVVHAETLADGFAVFEPDILAMMESFAVGPAPRGSHATRAHATWDDLLGTWKSADRVHEITLSPAGTIILDDRHGSYQIQAGNLVAHLDDGVAIFALDYQRGRLVVSGGMFGEGTSFARSARPGAGPGARRRPRPSR